MNVQQKNKKKGFTIIEVVLVLAIAGLIFLMVFIALPALQRDQRDTQRKNDMGRVITAIQNYQSNNRGALPAFNAAFIGSYLTVGGDSFSDPNGTAYSFTTNALPTSFVGDGDITYTVGSICNGGDALTANQGPNRVAIQIELEGGGAYCVNN